ncbi:Spike glycoprotein [Frankliniella fusca]|uniref:Spike glycoprotein n=1 Tax=Frankliniella fusca TaxID=407009 RepID=A0AAE1HNS9_9NEOP|nr:Spike glycoprotein [Frankliniella fusca]
MFRKLLLQDPSTTLVPGSGLCSACFTSISRSLENEATPPSSPDVESGEMNVSQEKIAILDNEEISDETGCNVEGNANVEKEEDSNLDTSSLAAVNPECAAGPSRELSGTPSPETTLSKGSSFSSDGTTGLEKLNDFLSTQNMSPLNKRQAKRSTGYRESKLAKIHETVQEVIEKVGEADVIIDKEKQYLEEILQQLLDKFAKVSTRQEKVNIISILPQSWSVDKIVSIFAAFNVSHKFVRGVKDLVKSEGGIFPTVHQRAKTGVAQVVVDTILKFYEEDETCVYIYPDKNKFLNVKINGQKVQKQKRLLLGNLRELYLAFKKQNPEYTISFAKFAELRPKYCLLAGAPGTHTQCVCEPHKNIELMFNAAMLRKSTQDDELPLKGYQELLKIIRCSDYNFSCVSGKCKSCPVLGPLQEILELTLDIEELDIVTFNSWTRKGARCHLETLTKEKEDFIEEFLSLMKEVNLHDFLAKKQAQFLRETKHSLQDGEAVVLMDFAENYRFLIQDSVQSYYFGQKECTIHPFVTYYFDKEKNKVSHLNYVVISDCLKYGADTIYTFQKSLIGFLKKNLPGLKKIYYFSDSPTSQYRNFKNVANLCQHEEEYQISAVWNFFETSHGKSPCDSLGGAIKRAASRASLQGQLIRDAHELVTWADERWNSPDDSKVTVGFVSDEEVQNQVPMLENRYSLALKVPAIMKMHYVKPISKYKVELKEFSAKGTSLVATVRKEET